MLEEGRISPSLASAALDRHRASGDRFEEALIGCGLPESMLLRHLAEMFNTRFISTKTLSGALVPRLTLSRLPRRLAERYQVVPIRFGEDDVLTVVATEPANPQLLENVRVAAGARLVMGLVARPAAIAAAIAKLYGGDNEAFAPVLQGDRAAPSRETGTTRRPRTIRFRTWCSIRPPSTTQAPTDRSTRTSTGRGSTSRASTSRASTSRASTSRLQRAGLQRAERRTAQLLELELRESVVR